MRSIMMLSRHFPEIFLLYACVALAKRIDVDLDTTTGCNRREFTFRASQTDGNGKRCWDHITAMSCWGRCDSGEIGDWRFPFKQSFHPVCLHDKREVRYAILQNCDPGADFRIADYEYYEALTCSCFICDSSSTSCQPPPSSNQNIPKDIFVRKTGNFSPKEIYQTDY